MSQDKARASFAERVFELMESHHMNASQFAAHVDRNSDLHTLHRNYITMLKKNPDKLPEAKTLLAIAQAFHVTTDYLLGIDQAENAATEQSGLSYRCISQLNELYSAALSSESIHSPEAVAWLGLSRMIEALVSEEHTAAKVPDRSAGKTLIDLLYKYYTLCELFASGQATTGTDPGKKYQSYIHIDPMDVPKIALLDIMNHLQGVLDKAIETDRQGTEGAERLLSSPYLNNYMYEKNGLKNAKDHVLKNMNESAQSNAFIKTVMAADKKHSSPAPESEGKGRGTRKKSQAAGHRREDHGKH